MQTSHKYNPYVIWNIRIRRCSVHTFTLYSTDILPNKSLQWNCPWGQKHVENQQEEQGAKLTSRSVSLVVSQGCWGCSSWEKKYWTFGSEQIEILRRIWHLWHSLTTISHLMLSIFDNRELILLRNLFC